MQGSEKLTFSPPLKGQSFRWIFMKIINPKASQKLKDFDETLVEELKTVITENFEYEYEEKSQKHLWEI